MSSTHHFLIYYSIAVKLHSLVTLFLMFCMYVQMVNLHGCHYRPVHLYLFVIMNRYKDLGGFHCVFYSRTSFFFLFAYSALYLFWILDRSGWCQCLSYYPLLCKNWGINEEVLWKWHINLLISHNQKHNQNIWNEKQSVFSYTNVMIFHHDM
jgi:hypothetical protein